MSQKLFSFVEGEMVTIGRNRNFGYHHLFGDVTLCGIHGTSKRNVHQDAAKDLIRCPKCIGAKKRLDAVDKETDWRPNELLPEDFHA